MLITQWSMCLCVQVTLTSITYHQGPDNTIKNLGGSVFASPETLIDSIVHRSGIANGQR